MTGGRRMPAALAAITTVWCAMAAAGPFLHGTGHHGVAAAVRTLFSLICHQDPARSFLIAGQPMALCSRCSGIYAGFLAGCLALLVARLAGRGGRLSSPPSRWVLLASIVPSALEAVAELTGLVTDGALLRALTGSLFGCAAAFYVNPAFEELPEQAAAELRRVTRQLTRSMRPSQPSHPSQPSCPS